MMLNPMLLKAESIFSATPYVIGESGEKDVQTAYTASLEVALEITQIEILSILMCQFADRRVNPNEFSMRPEGTTMLEYLQQMFALGLEQILLKDEHVRNTQDVRLRSTM